MPSVTVLEVVRVRVPRINSAIRRVIFTAERQMAGKLLQTGRAEHPRRTRLTKQPSGPEVDTPATAGRRTSEGAYGQVRVVRTTPLTTDENTQQSRLTNVAVAHTEGRAFVAPHIAFVAVTRRSVYPSV